MVQKKIQTTIVFHLKPALPALLFFGWFYGKVQPV
jgi:hypothetical protein